MRYPARAPARAGSFSGLPASSERSPPLKRFYVIFNPAASRGGAARSAAVISKAFADAGAECLLVPTQRRGHAVELVGEAIDGGWPAIVAVGGDGIVHEVANGLMRRAGEGTTLPLGIIPVGSGNDFVKMLGIPPHNPVAAVKRIVEAEPRQVDLGRVVRHQMGSGPEGVWYFTNGVGLGFDAQVANHAKRIQRLRGFAIYAWAVVKTLLDLRSPRIRVEVDGKEIADRTLILTTVSNGPCHGGNFWLCPGASIDDGQLDILIAESRSLAGVLRLLPKVIFGKHLTHWGVQLHRGSKVRVTSEVKLPIHADGEIVADWASDLEIEVLPGRLTVLA